MAIFGTDGIRGCFGHFPITESAVRALGRALSFLLLQEQNSDPYILVARDTRFSSPILEEAFTQGLLSLPSVKVDVLGVLPTPALAVATQSCNATAGVMITASHNPSTDNGLKIFMKGGVKLSSLLSQKLSAIFFTVLESEQQHILLYKKKNSSKMVKADQSYQDFFKNFVQKGSWLGVSLLVDCAHGAYSLMIESLLKPTGASYRIINNAPDGHNINENSGALEPSVLKPHINKYQPDFTIAVDGDGDRLLLFKGTHLIDPHCVLVFLHQLYASQGYEGGIITTEIANYGLQDYCYKKNIPIEITKVGDKFIMDKAREKGWLLGAEPSGHYIILDKSPSSDALLTAALLINKLKDEAFLLQQIEKELILYEQYNIKLLLPRSLKELFVDLEPHLYNLLPDEPALRAKIRPSGTEPVLRLVLQAPAESHIDLAGIANNWVMEAEKFFKYAVAQDLL